MKHSLAGAETPFVHLSYNHPKRAPGSIPGACHSYIFRTLALLGEKEGLPEPPRTLAVTESGRQDSNLRPSAPKANLQSLRALGLPVIASDMKGLAWPVTTNYSVFVVVLSSLGAP